MRAPLVLILLCTPAAALAQPVDGGVCGVAEHELAEARRRVQSLSAQLRAANEARQLCGEKLEGSTQQLAESREAVSACRDARENLCTAASTLVDGVLAGRTATNGLGACVDGEQQSRLADLLGGWAHATAVLSALDAYESGESDTLPAPRGEGRTRAEQLAQRLVSGGRSQAPLLFRRLLIRALELVTPRTWRRLRAGGAASLDAWFASSAKLDEGLVREAQSGAEDPSDGNRPLSAALRLVQAYRILAGCDERAPTARGCVRAQQLQELLESSGPLVARRRVQELWSTDCQALTPTQVLGWFQEFPSAHLAVGRSEWNDILDAATAKLYACFLTDERLGHSLVRWIAAQLPDAHALTGRTLVRIDELRSRFRDDSALDLCARAVRALQVLPTPRRCEAPPGFSLPVSGWLAHPASRDEGKAEPPLRACMQLARDLWEGKASTIAAAFPRPPTASEMVSIKPGVAETPVARLRKLCDQRRGSDASFVAGVGELAQLAHGFGEQPAAAPWRYDRATGRPVEAQRFASARSAKAWLTHLVLRRSACQTLELPGERCQQCSDGPAAFYDCALVARIEARWSRLDQWLVITLFGLLSLISLLVWLSRLRRAFVEFGGWSAEVTRYLETLAVEVRPDPLRWLMPSRLKVLTLDLPEKAAWERWGKRAVVLRTAQGGKVTEGDVNAAAAAARAVDAEVALLLSDEDASPDLAAVRAILEWAAKGAKKAVQILPLSTNRLKWARSADDLLDLVEQTSLRGNPFEVRGRITSSSQFFDRERLVSGLLAGAQAGHWIVVTGLRRFGKSSLALEVARRLPGPSAYVDLAGFHHEIAFLPDGSQAADAILRYLCLQLTESARTHYSGVRLPEPPAAGEPLDAAELARWFRAYVGACTEAAGGRPPAILLAFDELEQAIGVGPDRLGHALDVLAILVGRLRNSLSESAFPQGGARIGILLCSALHPLLWAPLSTLAHQSLMGSFSSVCVPRLPTDAALAMMRGLGARQGIRFTDAALDLIIREAQGVPLLVRRIGSSVLELYDPERARQGSLGAVEIGIEGASAALRREEEEGSPLRVWVESEIADLQTPAGVVLRQLAAAERMDMAALRAVATQVMREQFALTGIARTLPPVEAERRAEEAAGVLTRLLGETGLLEPEGDPLTPDGYHFPDGAIRRILRSERRFA
jgi:hypothetical protein